MQKYREMTINKNIYNYYIWDAAKDVVETTHRKVNAKRDRPHITEKPQALIDDRERAMRRYDIEEAIKINKEIKKQKRWSKKIKNQEQHFVLNAFLVRKHQQLRNTIWF